MQHVQPLHGVAGRTAMILLDRHEAGEELRRDAPRAQPRQIDVAFLGAFRQAARAFQHVTQGVAVGVDDDGVEVQCVGIHGVSLGPGACALWPAE